MYWLLSASLALAAPSIGSGAQSITVVVSGAPGGTRIEAEQEGVGKLVLEDSGHGYMEGELRGPPARTAQLALTAISGARIPLYEGTLVLAERTAQVVSFEVVEDHGRYRAIRTVAAPSADATLLPDPTLAPAVRLGFGVLAVLYVAGAAIAWARRD